MTRLMAGRLRFHDHAVGFATIAAAWGSLAGSHTTGTRRKPVRASAPAARTAGNARPDVSSVTPRVGAGPQTPELSTSGLLAVLPSTPWLLGQGGPQLTATAGEDHPEPPAVTVHQFASAP